MSVSFEITSSIQNYRVEIANGLIRNYRPDTTDYVILCDAFFASALSLVHDKVIPIQVSESAKGLDQISSVIVSLKEVGALRKTLLIAVGGGVIQDIATFTSSIYMRGIPWIYLPTTLLGMVDSCIGGKSAINVGSYKNLVGNFYPPGKILIDPAAAETLGQEQLVAGLCEAAKICYARGRESFAEYLRLYGLHDQKLLGLQAIIELSLRSKKWFIEKDEFDRQERLLLNFGHTFGHAIEGAAGYRISHGVAVGVGMLAAVYLAGLLHGGSLPDRAQQLRTHILSLLNESAGLTDVMVSLSPLELFDRFEADKKHTDVCYTLIGLSASGDLQLLQLPKLPESRTLINQVFGEIVTNEFWERGFSPLE